MNRRIFVGYIITLTAGFSFGAIPVIIALLRDADTSVIEQAFLRLSLGGFTGFGVLMYAYLIQNEEFHFSSLKRVQKSYLWQSLVFTLAIIAYIISIVLETPVGQASLLIQVHPIITLILGYFLLREEINKNKLFSIILGFFGLILLTQPWKWQSVMDHLVGDLLAMTNGMFYAIYLLIGAHSTQIREKIPFYISIAWVLFWGFLWGFLLLFILTLLPLPASYTLFNLRIFVDPYILGLGIILTIMGSIIPYGLIMLSNKFNIESSKQSILLLGEPVAAIILGLVILSEPITFWYIAGGFVLIIAIINLIISEQD
ncbi:MAG: DMT family transporter [Candidatus Hodarchaeales archaeon]|jgi:drug/metabolite transporter (DMT)-like permease